MLTKNIRWRYVNQRASFFWQATAAKKTVKKFPLNALAPPLLAASEQTYRSSRSPRGTALTLLVNQKPPTSQKKPAVRLGTQDSSASIAMRMSRGGSHRIDRRRLCCCAMREATRIRLRPWSRRPCNVDRRLSLTSIAPHQRHHCQRSGDGCADQHHQSGIERAGFCDQCAHHHR
jgi:hypothetical protein